MHPPLRRASTRARRPLTAALFACTLIVTACSSGSGSSPTTTESPATSTPPDGTDANTTPDADTPTRRSGIVLASTDGTAAVGSRTVFVVTGADGATTVVAAPGRGDETRAEVELAPGTYTISMPAPSVSELASFSVSQMSATEVTVTEPTDDAPEQFAAVEFSLDAQPVPVVLRVDSVSATTIGLSWQSLGDVTVASYELRALAGIDAAEGTPIALAAPTATDVVITGLAPSTEYTFALYPTAESGEALPTRSISATTSAIDGGTTAYALAPNTILPTDFESLHAELIAPSQVRIKLDPAALQRASASEVPGVDDSAFAGSGCVVGTPFLLSSDVAGDNAFFGVIDVCEIGPSGFGQSAPAAAVSTAIVNTDVPLGVVFSYFDYHAVADPTCFDGLTGVALGAGAPECGGVDSDGDGIPDDVELLIGTDPADPDTDGDGLDDGTEYHTVGSDPLNADSDFDRLSDREEIDLGTDPLRADTDGDGCWDSGEVTAGTNPLDAADVGACPIEGDAPSWQQLVDVSRQEHRGRDDVAAGGVAIDAGTSAEPEDIGDISDLDAPERLGGGAVQVTLLWATGDDLDLHVTEPDGSVIFHSQPTSPSGGQLDVDDRGGDCTSDTLRAENIFWDTAPPAGAYVVDVENYQACGDGPVGARIQVRIDGALVVDQQVVVGSDGPITFEVAGTEPAGLRVSPPRAGAVPAALVMPAAPAALVTEVELECEGSATAEVSIRPYLGPHNDVDFTLNWAAILWDVEVGVKASIKPFVEVQGKIECSLDLPSLTFQLTTYPVPINLELSPIAEAGATATLTLDGPEAALVLGVASEGRVDFSVETCTWFEVPCGIDIDVTEDTAPVASFTVGAAELTLQGELALGLGVDAKLGVGIKNTFVTAKTGFSFKLVPIAAKVQATVGTSNCASISVGASLGVDLLTEAYLLKWGDESRVELWDGEITYPKAKAEIGDCPDD